MTTDDGIDVTAQRSGPIAELRIETEPFVLRQLLAALDETAFAHVAAAARSQLGWSD